MPTFRTIYHAGIILMLEDTPFNWLRTSSPCGQFHYITQIHSIVDNFIPNVCTFLLLLVILISQCISEWGTCISWRSCVHFIPQILHLSLSIAVITCMLTFCSPLRALKKHYLASMSISHIFKQSSSTFIKVKHAFSFILVPLSTCQLHHLLNLISFLIQPQSLDLIFPCRAIIFHLRSFSSDELMVNSNYLEDFKYGLPYGIHLHLYTDLLHSNLEFFFSSPIP